MKNGELFRITPSLASAHRLFEAQVTERGPQIAAQFENQVLSYGDLNRRANRLARRLQNLCIRPGDCVGISTERCLEMPIGVLGILKAGAVYLPIDPQYPSERIRFMMEDAGARLIVDPAMIRLEADQYDDTNLNVPDAPESTAYIIYTSGSTGRPKGVAVPQRALSNLLQTVMRDPGVSANDVFLAVSTLSFDIATAELLLPLVAGGRLVIARSEVARDGQELLRALEESQATILQGTPSFLRILLEAGWQGTPGIRVFSTGEPLPANLARALLNRDCALWNLYGPTETTIWSTIARITSVEGSVPIGRPVANTRVYLVDPATAQVPAGVPGELCIGGSGVASGYCNLPELTAERFVADPFSPGGDGRMYRTGDLCRYRLDGQLELLGRLDNQLKVRGYRVEPEEIEAVLEQHTGVIRVLVTARPQASGTESLVAYVLMETGEDLPVDALRGFLRDRLPEYMIPAEWLPLKSVPLTPNGKLDRKALSRLAADAPSAPQEAPQSCTRLERSLMLLWQKVLGRMPRSVDDHFFELGGQSLEAVLLVNAVRDELRKSLPVVAVFSAPTVREMARVLEDNPVADPGSALVPIQPGGSRRPLFVISLNGAGRYHHLARYLGPDQPVYGFQVPLFVEDQQLETLIEPLVQEIRRVQPVGPYRITGYCLDGIAALEAAQILQRSGQEMDVLALVDSFGPDFRIFPENLPRPLWYLDRLRAFFDRNLGNLAGSQPDARPAYLRQELGRVWRRLLGMVRDTLRPKASGPDAAIPTPDAAIPTYVKLVDDYKPRPYAGKILLLHSRQYGRWPHDPTLGWRVIASGGLDVHHLGGYHGDLLTAPHVRNLATVLSQCLERAAASEAAVAQGAECYTPD